MLPLITDGSRIDLVPASADSVAPGDIIVFRMHDRLLAHRLIDRRKDGERVLLREKGDHRVVASWIEADSLVGRAIAASTPHTGKRLDVPHRALRLRILTALSRLEADILDRYLAFRSPRTWFRPVRYAALCLAALAWPARALLFRLLLTVYPRDTCVESEDSLRFTLAVFRSLREPGEDLSGPAAAVRHWEDTVALAWRHGIAPLMSSRPPMEPADGTVPAGVIEACRKLTYRAVMTHSSARAVLGEVHAAFCAKHVPYAVLKGAGLYESLYKNIVPRAYADIDLLIPRGRIAECLDILAALDYRPVCGGLRRFLLRHGHFHLPLESADSRRPRIELHWALIDGMNLCRPVEADVLARARLLTTARSAFRVLAIEDQLIYLCLHIAKHGLLNDIGLRAGWDAVRFLRRGAGNRLAWFMDVELFLDTCEKDLDWGETAARIEQWNAAGAVQQSLDVLRVLSPSSRATAALERLQPVCTPAAAHPREAKRRASSGDRIERIAGRAGGMSRIFFFRPVRLLRLGGILFPERERLQRYYGEHRTALLPWLYLSHPFRLLARVMFAGKGS